MTKKIRLIDEPAVADESAITAEAAGINTEVDATTFNNQLMKYLEAIDWKLWEMLKMMKADHEEKTEDK
mgnify:CR=1 FL=1|jgi:hypothetical protein